MWRKTDALNPVWSTVDWFTLFMITSRPALPDFASPTEHGVNGSSGNCWKKVSRGPRALRALQEHTPLNCCFPVMHHLSVQVRVPRGAEAKPGTHNWWSTDNPAAVWVSFILLQHVSQCLHRHQGSYGILLSWYKPWSVCTVLWIRSSSSSLCIPYQQHHIFTPDVEASGRSILIKQIFNPKDVKKVEECSRALECGNNTRCLAHFLCPSLGFPWIRTR